MPCLRAPARRIEGGHRITVIGFPVRLAPEEYQRKALVAFDCSLDSRFHLLLDWILFTASARPPARRDWQTQDSTTMLHSHNPGHEQETFHEPVRKFDHSASLTAHEDD
jgi:hypothetical protein